MTTAYTSLLGLALPVTGELSGTWGDTVNNSITSLVDTAVAGTTNVSADSNVTLTTTTGASNQARQAILLFSGARTAIRTVTAPAQSKIYTVINATTGGFAVQLVGAGPTTGVTIANGARTVVAWNGSDFVEVSSPSSIILPGGTANGVLYLNGSKVVTSGSALTFDGTNLGVGVASPTFKLQIAGANSSSGGINITGTGTNGLRLFQDAATGDSYINNFQNGFMAFSNNNTERMRLDSSGNLGLGVTPSAWVGYKVLQAGIGSFIGGSSGAYLLQDNAYTDNSGAGWKYINSSYAAAQYYAASGAHVWRTAPSGTAGNAITFTQAMTLDASGNLGIGTTTPGATLNVGSSNHGIGIAFMSAGTLPSLAGAYTAASSWGQTNYGSLVIKARTDFGGFYSIDFVTASSDNTPVTRARIDSSGNFGLGVTPSAGNGGKTIEVNTLGNIIRGGTVNDMNVDSNAYFNSGWKYAGTGYATRYACGANIGNHEWYIAASGTAGNAISFTQAMTLTAGGNLLVGATSGASKLYVSDSSSPANQSVYFENTNGSLTQRVLSINATRNTTNGTYKYLSCSISTVQEKFYVFDSGSAYNITGTYGTISDIKLKENIVDTTPKLDDVMQLQVRNFNFKATPEEKHIGFIAQEFEQVFPSMVDVDVERDENGEETGQTTKTIKTSVLIPVLVKAIQEQQAIIESLKARLDAANL